MNALAQTPLSEQLASFEVFASNIELSRILWSVIQGPFVPWRTAYRLAGQVAAFLLIRLEKDGVYLDSRFAPLVAKIGQVSHSQISLRELRTYQAIAVGICREVKEYPDERTRIAARAVVAALDADPYLAVNQIFYIYTTIYSTDEDAGIFRDVVVAQLDRDSVSVA